MGIKLFRLSFLICACAFFWGITTHAQTYSTEQHIRAFLRVIGHQMLLSSADSTSRVLPIIKTGNQYQIQFESDLQLDPAELIYVADSVMNQEGVSSSYLVEVKACETQEVVHSYEVKSETNLGLLPCRGRILPKACYQIYVTFPDGVLFQDLSQYATVKGSKTEVVNSSEKGSYVMFLFAAIPLLALSFSVWKKKKQPNKEATNIVEIGAYQFDKHTLLLLFEEITVELTSKEADLLLLLFDSVNETVERKEILKQVWADEGNYVGRTLDVYISKLRKKLKFDPNIKIMNIRGVGYKFVLSM